MSNTRPENLPDDLVIKREWDLSQLELSPDDKIAFIDYHSESKQTLFLKNNALIVCDENLNIVIKKQIQLDGPLRCYEIFKAYFLPNGYIAVHAKDNCRSLLLFDSSLNQLANEDLGEPTNECHIFIEDSYYLLTVLDDHFHLYKINTDENQIDDLGTFPFGNQIKSAKSSSSWVDMHVFSDNTLIFFSNDDQHIYFSLGEIKNDALVIQSITEFDKIQGNCLMISSSFLSDQECLLKCISHLDSNQRSLNAYSLKKLEMDWKVEKIASYSHEITSTLDLAYHYLPHPLYAIKKNQGITPDTITTEQYITPDTITNTDTNTTHSFQDFDLVIPTRNNKLYIIHDGRLLLTSFIHSKSIKNTLNSILPNDLVPIVTGYLHNSIFSSGISSVNDKENIETIVKSVSPRLASP